jgi:Tfp pilus assembly protein PilV
MAVDSGTATLITGTAAAVGSTTVGVAAIYFSWRSTRESLQEQRKTASENRLWEEQRNVYQQLADWLAAHPVAGSSDPLYEVDVFSTWTSDPGQEVQGKARLFAHQPVLDALKRVRDAAYVEDKTAQMARIARDFVERGGTFEESQGAMAFGWKGPSDAHKDLKPLRESWTTSRDDLEAALRDVYREDRKEAAPAGI